MTTYLVGWDIGGAHLKASVRASGVLVDVAQWPCPLWRGVDHLAHALECASSRWPFLDEARHVVTMSGEMADLFVDRADGVSRITSAVAQRWPHARCYAGDAGWVALDEGSTRWPQIASANWLATARHTALALGDGLLIDIGSTTTDLIPLSGGRVLSTARSDFERLATGELVYHGVVRTPISALAPRVLWGDFEVNVMHELFATTADVYRLTGELRGEHDQQETADGGDKDLPATRRRLARMIGRDAADGTEAEWLALAQLWRSSQVAEIGGQLQRVAAHHDLSRDTPAVAAGCGAFLVPSVLAAVGWGGTCLSYARDVVGVGPALARWADVCAPAVAVAALSEKEPCIAGW
jgi:probable H4MPT-linked C1 transfer pathway protein